MPGREHTRAELKKSLLVDLDRARLALARHKEEAAATLSPAAMVERSFKKHRAAWLAGATLAGAIVLRLVLTSSSSKNERDNSAKSGTKGRLFRMLSAPLIAVGRKAALNYATQYFKNNFKQPFPESASEQDPI